MKSNVTGYRGLISEKSQNEKTILKLTRRNKEIERALIAIDNLVKGTSKRSIPTNPTTPAKVSKPRDVKRAGITNKVLGALADGQERHTHEIAKTVYGRNVDQDTKDAVARACSYLVETNKLVKTKHATYRAKHPKKNTEKTTTNVGHDTRVTQVPKRQGAGA